MIDSRQGVAIEACTLHKNLNILGRNIYVFREVSSTNTVAQGFARAGTAEGTFILSSSQSSGMGRMKRQWTCPASKGLLMSMILRPQISQQYVPQLTLLCSVVVAETLQKITGVKAGIKWPNDIVIGGKKVCGILAQSSFQRNAAPFVIMGIGINVNQVADQLPPDCRETSTSLKLEVGRKVSRLKILKEFIILWEEHYQRFLTNGHLYLRNKWLENNVTLGKSVSIKQEENSIHGVATDISECGGLIVTFSDGTSQEFLAEDVSLGRTHYKSLV